MGYPGVSSQAEGRRGPHRGERGRGARGRGLGPNGKGIVGAVPSRVHGIRLLRHETLERHVVPPVLSAPLGAPP